MKKFSAAIFCLFTLLSTSCKSATPIELYLYNAFKNESFAMTYKYGDVLSEIEEIKNLEGEGVFWTLKIEKDVECYYEVFDISHEEIMNFAIEENVSYTYDWGKSYSATKDDKEYSINVFDEGAVDFYCMFTDDSIQYTFRYDYSSDYANKSLIFNGMDCKLTKKGNKYYREDFTIIEIEKNTKLTKEFVATIGRETIIFASAVGQYSSMIPE